MRKVTFDEEGNIVASYPEDEDDVKGYEWIAVDENIVEKIMQNPRGFKVVDGEVVETGYEVEIIDQPDEIERLKEKIAMQDTVIEELIFTIIPELTGGGM
ncbi:hypothetical protein K0H71_15230 [Bacillus sp. IITD106]|nr:hypothetical protein [Bacillus sp. IITD106]